MKFVRNTHDENGNPREGLPQLPGMEVGLWPTCNIQMLMGEMTVEEIYMAHKEYDRQWEGEGIHSYTMADILDGLANLIRLGIVRFIADE